MATKGRPFTVRLKPEVERRLEEEAKRARRPKTVMLEALADEALRMRRFPGIGFVGPEHDRRAYLSGTGLEVWEVVEIYRDYGEEGRRLMLGAHPIQEPPVGRAELRLARTPPQDQTPDRLAAVMQR